MSPEFFARYLALQAKQVRQRRAAVAHRARSLQSKHDAEAVEEALWLQHMQQLGVLQGDVVMVTAPSGPDHESNLAAQRREAHKAHLESIIAEACLVLPQMPRTMQADEHGAESVADPLAGRLCSLCAGGCCTNGGDTAYLSVATLLRVLMDQGTGLNADSLLAHYLGFVPGKSMRGSCIYHTINGCNLPRDWRSDVCNRYRCEALRTLPGLPQKKPGDASTSVLVLQRAQDHWRGQEPGFRNEIVRAVLLSKDGNMLLPVPPPQSAGGGAVSSPELSAQTAEITDQCVETCIPCSQTSSPCGETVVVQR